MVTAPFLSILVTVTVYEPTLVALFSGTVTVFLLMVTSASFAVSLVTVTAAPPIVAEPPLGIVPLVVAAAATATGAAAVAAGAAGVVEALADARLASPPFIAAAARAAESLAAFKD